MSPRVIGAVVVFATALSCTRRPPPPPPCQGLACRAWPHIELKFWRNHPAPEGHRYTGALCVQVAFDCPEYGRDPVWIEPQAPRCRTYLREETSSVEWLRVDGGRLSIPWPAHCAGNRVEMYVTAQPNFAVCNAINNRLVVADRQGLSGDVVFECR